MRQTTHHTSNTPNVPPVPVDPQIALADLATRRDARRPYDLLAFSALPDAPVQPYSPRRARRLPAFTGHVREVAAALGRRDARTARAGRPAVAGGDIVCR